MTFVLLCSDAISSYPEGVLQPGIDLSDTKLSFKWQARVRGLEVEELVALSARMRSANQMVAQTNFAFFFLSNRW
jgi:hypothetical protein